MRALILLSFILIGSANLSAQDTTLVTIKAGNKVSDVLTHDEIYFYPQFTMGEIFLKEGKKIVVDMNYTRIFDQMLFINHKGDTLALADVKNIKLIVIEQDTFYYDQGYVRLIADYGYVKLSEKQAWVVADVRKIGAYNTPTNTVAVTSLTAYTNGQDAAKSKDLILNEEIVLRRETQYFFGDDYNNFVHAAKKKLLNLFPKDERAIENYLKDNKVDFNKKEDLEKLAQFLSKY